MKRGMQGGPLFGIALFLIVFEIVLRFEVGLAPNDLPVHNVNTGLNYATIQEAIDAHQTQDGHTIKVDTGTFPSDLINIGVIIDDNYIPPYSDPNVSNDHQFVLSTLSNIGYDITVIYEIGTYHSDDAVSLSYSNIKDFNAVIWVGDTKHWDDNATANALYEFYKNGGGVLLIGDDATWGQTEPWLNWGQFLSWTAQPNLTHLKTLDNGWVYNHYVNINHTEHPIIKGIEGVTFSYDLDIDYTEPRNEGEIILAYNPNTDSIDNVNNKNEPVIVAYDGRTKGEGRTITILLVLSRVLSNVAEKLLVNSLEWIMNVPLEIDQTFVSDARVDVGSSHTIGFHAGWINNGSDVVRASIFVNGTEHITNETGWVSFNYSSSSVGKKTWVITGVNANGVTSYRQTAENPSIIWDKVTIKLENNRVNVGSEATVSYEAFYEYDGETFAGSIMLNDTVFTQDILGKRGYKAIGITDDKYQLTQFTSNEAYVIFDRIKASYQIETLSPGALKVIVNVWYEYDDAPVGNTRVKVNGVISEYLGNGVYVVNLPLWMPYQNVNIEIQKTAFIPIRYNVTAHSLGNIVLWAFLSFSTISAMAFSRAKWIHKRKLRNLRDLIINRKKISINELMTLMNVKRKDAEKLLHELKERKMVEGFFTSDGKAFITEEKLKEEILRGYNEKG
jgi:hypothetical protein